MQTEPWPAINPERIRGQAFDCILQIGQTILLLVCRSLWIFAISGIFSRLPRREGLAARLTDWEFRNRVFRSKCGIWKPIFAFLCSTAGGNGVCSLHEGWYFTCTAVRFAIS